MIDLIAAGLALRERLIVSLNPHAIRNDSATDPPYSESTSAISAESAEIIYQKQLNDPNQDRSIKGQIFEIARSAEIADIAENHASRESLTAELMRNDCGLSTAFSSISSQLDILKFISCDLCEHFSPDDIGDGAGIGTCKLGIKWTQEYNGRKPLYRYADRHCEKFSKLMS